MRHKQEILRPGESIMYACDLNVGDYAVICDEDGNTNGFHGGEIVTRAYGDILVKIADPIHTWSLGERSMWVKRLQDGVKFSITVRDER